MKKEFIQTRDGEKLELIISEDGACYCPVCGVNPEDPKWRPYDRNGLPSYDICSCGFQYGYDDGGIPNEQSWTDYRQKWLNGEILNEAAPSLTLSQKKAQLKNIGI